MNKHKVTIVIPTYNEEKMIKEVIEKVRPHGDHVLVVSAKKSTDRTAEIAKSMGVEVIVDNGKGKGEGMRCAIKHIQEGLIVFIDADGSHIPKDIPSIVAPLQADEADMVIASRFMGGSEELHGDFDKFLRMFFEDKNIDDEIYYLLDPCEEDDPNLLAFDMEGKAIPSDHCGEWDRLRVEVTVEKLKLFHEPLQEARRDVWNTCENLINECENLAISFHENPSVTKRQRIRDIRTRLREMMNASAEFSRVAIACLCNSDTTTARKILTPI